MNLEEIKLRIKELSAHELVELRDWLDDAASDAEDSFEVTDEFKAKIEQGERDLKAGNISRIRRPEH